MKIENIQDMNFQVIDCDVPSQSVLTEDVMENGGSLEGDHFIVFESNGVEVCVEFSMSVTSDIYTDKGDYMNQPFVGVDLTKDIKIDNVLVNDVVVSLNESDMNFFKEKIVKFI